MDAPLRDRNAKNSLFRLAVNNYYETPDSSLLTPNFDDADMISTWAVDAMNWAVGESLINGMGDGTVAPQGTATRAQVATMIMRYA